MENKFICKPIGDHLFAIIGLYAILFYYSAYLIFDNEIGIGLLFFLFVLFFIKISNKYLNYCILKNDHVEIKTLFGKRCFYFYKDISKVKYTRPYLGKGNKGFKFFNNNGKMMYFEYVTQDEDEIIAVTEFLIDKGVDVRFLRDWDDSYIQLMLKEKYRMA